MEAGGRHHPHGTLPKSTTMFEIHHHHHMTVTHYYQSIPQPQPPDELLSPGGGEAYKGYPMHSPGADPRGYPIGIPQPQMYKERQSLRGHPLLSPQGHKDLRHNPLLSPPGFDTSRIVFDPSWGMDFGYDTPQFSYPSQEDSYHTKSRNIPGVRYRSMSSDRHHRHGKANLQVYDIDCDGPPRHAPEYIEQSGTLGRSHRRHKDRSSSMERWYEKEQKGKDRHSRKSRKDAEHKKPHDSPKATRRSTSEGRHLKKEGRSPGCRQRLVYVDVPEEKEEKRKHRHRTQAERVAEAHRLHKLNKEKEKKLREAKHSSSRHEKEGKSKHHKQERSSSHKHHQTFPLDDEPEEIWVDLPPTKEKVPEHKKSKPKETRDYRPDETKESKSKKEPKTFLKNIKQSFKENEIEFRNACERQSRRDVQYQRCLSIWDQYEQNYDYMHKYQHNYEERVIARHHSVCEQQQREDQQAFVQEVVVRRWSLLTDTSRWTQIRLQSSEGSSGPPPPVPRSAPHPAFKERSQSVTTNKADCTTLPPPHNGRQRTVSSGARLHRQRSYKRTEEEDKIKKSRGWANAYELSQDLHDKQLEMLERKYGGHLRTKHAARIIQQAFRQYCMNKNFEKLRTVATEKRLSQRLCNIGRSNTIWSDMVVDHRGFNVNLDLKRASMTTETCFNEHMTYEDNVNQNIRNDTMVTTRGVLTKSKSLSISVTGQIQSSQRQKQRALELNLPSVNEPQRQDKRSAQGTVPEETNNNRNSCPELNDSDTSDSPHGTPMEHHAVDLASVNFENLLESKESDILNDSFHSDGSQGAVGPHGVFPDQVHDGTMERLHRMLHAPGALDSSMVEDEMDGDATLKASQRTYDNYMCDSAHESDLHMNSSVLSNDVDRTPTHDDGMVKVYANQEVRLRKKRSSSLDETSSTPQPDCTSPSRLSPEASPIWKRKSALGVTSAMVDDAKRMSNISEVSEPDSTDGRESREGLSSSTSSDTASLSSDGGHLGYQRALSLTKEPTSSPQAPSKISDRQRKRMYRIGLNLFNKKPEKGIKYLIERRFVDNRPSAVAKFLIARKGLSKQMIGEFLGNLQNPFNRETLECFANEISLSGMQIDMALRRFQSYFRMPGEAQKIERIVECFSHWYCMMNQELSKKFRTVDTVFLLSFAIIMLNTDLHNASIKPERKMKEEDFIKNLRGLDDGEDIDHELLVGVYDRIKNTEFKSQADHVTQVMKVEQMLVGKKPTSQLSLPHRRLVCYCRLYEVNDPNKREKPGLHQREVFLFNDMLMVTKIFSRKKNNITYSFRNSFSLCGMMVYLFETQHYPHGIRLTTNLDNKVLITFNARNEHDRSKFVEDLKEAIAEMNEMEALRIEEELQKQKMVGQLIHNFNRHSNDSGMVDIELLKPSDPGVNRLSAPECGLKKSALSNSLIDLESSARRGSGGSLDSGMASTSSGSTGSRDDAHVPPPTSNKTMKSQSSGSKFSIFGRKSKNPSKTSLRNSTDCSEV